MIKSSLRTLTALVMFPLLFSCAFAQFKSPRSYRAATPAEVKTTKSDAVVHGESCFQQVLFLVACGEGGYAGATSDALKGQAEGSELYDVKSDTDLFNVLGVYSKLCTRVTGKLGKI